MDYLENTLSVLNVDESFLRNSQGRNLRGQAFDFLRLFGRDDVEVIVADNPRLQAIISLMLSSRVQEEDLFVNFGSNTASANLHRHERVVISAKANPETVCVSEQAAATSLELAMKGNDFYTYLSETIGFTRRDPLPLTFKGMHSYSEFTSQQPYDVAEDESAFRNDYTNVVASRFISNRRELDTVLLRHVQISFMIDNYEIRQNDFIKEHWLHLFALQNLVQQVATDTQIQALDWSRVLLAGVRQGTIHFRKLYIDKLLRSGHSKLLSLNGRFMDLCTHS